MSEMDSTVHESVTSRPLQAANEKYGAELVGSLKQMYQQQAATRGGTMRAMRADAEQPKEEITVTRTQRQTKYQNEPDFGFF